jgi:DNA-binding XRE family transcriptional regulator
MFTQNTWNFLFRVREVRLAMTASESRQKVLSSPAQIAGAREYLGMSQAVLAEAAGVGRTTVVAFERGNRTAYESTRAKLQEALEARGIVFTNGNKPGFYFDRDKATIPIADERDRLRP